jgi:hypothetical protein
MIETHEMTEEEFNRTVLRVIHREFGLGGLARFIRLNRSGTGNYTRERHKWQSNLTLEDIWRDMEAKGLTQK